MNDDLIVKINGLAGSLRAETFRAAAEFILGHGIIDLIETGTYRGCDGDGESTVILATVAAVNGGSLTSIDIDADHVDKSREHAKQHGLSNITWIVADSVATLSRMTTPTRFVYLDSFDHDPSNPGPCQRHELAEMGAIYGKLDLGKPCAILLDDSVSETGGKTLLGKQFLLDRGWHLSVSGYQLFFTWGESLIHAAIPTTPRPAINNSQFMRNSRSELFVRPIESVDKRPIIRWLRGIWGRPSNDIQIDQNDFHFP